METIISALYLNGGILVCGILFYKYFVKARQRSYKEFLEREKKLMEKFEQKRREM